MLLRTTLAVALVVLAACKSETSTTTTTSADTTTTVASTPAPEAPAAPAAPTSRDVCAMLSADELKTAAGIDGAGKASKSGGADVCSWFGSSGKALVVQVYPYASSYDNARDAFEGLYGTKAQDQSGIGDKAYVINGKTGPMATATLVTVKGATPISVQVMGGKGDDASRVKDATNVAQLLLGKL